MKLRTPGRLELAAYLAWSDNLIGRANRRWAEIRPEGSPLALVDRDLLAHALLLRLAPSSSLPRGYNSRQARAWMAALFADAPKAVKAEARAYLVEIHRLATEQPQR